MNKCHSSSNFPLHKSSASRTNISFEIMCF
jgi:hypothetical protein